MSKKILVIGKSGRVDCLAETLARSSRAPELFGFSEVHNPGLLEKTKLRTGKTDDVDAVGKYAREVKPDMAIIGPEEPLAAGIVDILQNKYGIPCVGPTRSLAKIETSKTFARTLLTKYGIEGNPEYSIFKNLNGIDEYFRTLGDFVIKPDGLTGGKGVKVFGEHITSFEEARIYCQELFSLGHESVVIEEKLDGEEFSLQSFCDGKHVVDTVVVQDHKRAYDGDRGPNTGGMGSYSCEDHSLPFLEPQHIADASAINAAVAEALFNETREEYKGILYGGFILTKHGIRLIEYNARFGDPEVLNILPILKTDFVDVCDAIVNGSLDRVKVQFEDKATVCKYVVPEGYPETPKSGQKLNMDKAPTPNSNLKIYYGAVDKKNSDLNLIGSRAVACVGIGDSLEEAEKIAEFAASSIQGPVRHREDIGTNALVHKRLAHMEQVRAQRSPLRASTG